MKQKPKIPTGVCLHPHTGEQALYDSDLKAITTLSGADPIPLSDLEGRELTKLREWIETLEDD
jgi:hypothetical protein